MITLLIDVYEHMKKDYDFMMVITGDTGTGKSHFALNLFETWYRCILKKPVTKDMVKQISQNYQGWLKSFSEIGEYDMNIFDESARDLNSIDFATRISKDINKLFDVCRCKKFFSVVILPNFFRLNKALREDRIRGLVWVYKRGQYMVFSKEDLKYLNGYNERRKIKSMRVARPSFCASFPGYKGVLLKDYEERKMSGVDEVLEEVMGSISKTKKTLTEEYQDEVNELIDAGKTYAQIRKELSIGSYIITQCRLAKREKQKRGIAP